MREKKTTMKNFSELHFSFEVPRMTEIEDTKFCIIFTSEKCKPKVDNNKVLTSNLVTIKPDKNPFRKSDQKRHINKYEGDEKVIEKKTDIVEKLRLIKTFLSPIVNEITSSASNLTETEIKQLQINKSPLCKIPLEAFAAARKASKLLKEVNAELYEKNLLNFPQNTFIVNTLYYPDGDINKEPLNFDKHIYVDKGLMKQLLELQKILANIIDELGLSAGVPETSGSETNESTNKSDDISYPSHSDVMPIFHNSVPQSHSKEKKIKLKDPASEEIVDEIVRCLAELSDVRKLLVKARLHKKIDFSNEILLTGSPRVRDCCLKNDVPHLHAKLNGIPVIIKINKETMDILLKTINKDTNEKRSKKEENKLRKMEKKERKQEEKREQKEKKATAKRNKKEKAATSPQSKKKSRKKVKNTKQVDPRASFNKSEIKSMFNGESLMTTTYESADSVNNEIDEPGAFDDDDDDDDGDDDGSENSSRIKLSESRMVNRSTSHLRLLRNGDSNENDIVNLKNADKPKQSLSDALDESNSHVHLRLLRDGDSNENDIVNLKNADKPKQSLSNALDENVGTKNFSNQSSQVGGEEILEVETLKNIESSEIQNSRTENKNITSSRDKFTDSVHNIDEDIKSKNNKLKGMNSELLRSVHSIDVVIESKEPIDINGKNDMNENQMPGKSLEDELLASFHDTDDDKSQSPINNSSMNNSPMNNSYTSSPTQGSYVEKSLDNEIQTETDRKRKSTCNISVKTIASKIHITTSKHKNVMGRSCLAPSKLSLKCCCSQTKQKQSLLRNNRYGKKKNNIVCINDGDVSKYSQTDPKDNEKDLEYQVMRATTTFEKPFHQIKAFDRNFQVMPCKIAGKHKQFSVNRRPQKQYNFDVPVELLGANAQKMLFDIRSDITRQFGNVPLNISRKEQVRTYVVTLETDSDNKSNFNKTSVFKEQLIIEQTINNDSYKMFEDKSISARIHIPPKMNVTEHPYINKFKEIGIKNIIDAYEPAECCRKSFLNEFPEPSMPYPPSLMSLPLDDSDLKEINETVTTNFWYDKLQYYMSLGKDDMQWPPHTYEVRYFVISDGLEEEPTKECKNTNTTEVLYDSAWKYQMYNIKMIRDVDKCKKLMKPPPSKDHLINQSQKKFKDLKSMPMKKAFQTPIETPYSPSAHSLPGVGLIAVPEMYRASRSSLPPSSSNIQMVLPLTTTKSKKIFDDDTSLSPEHFATYKENGRGNLFRNSKNMQTSATFIKKRTIVCTASQTPSRKPLSSSFCVKSETTKPESESAKVEVETVNKCKPCSTVTNSNELTGDNSTKPITICRPDNNTIKNQPCHPKSCKKKRSDIFNSIASVEITEMKERPSKENKNTDKPNKVKKVKSSSSYGSSSKSKGQFETSSIEEKKSTSMEKSLTLKSPTTKSATSIGSKTKTDSKNKPSKQQLKMEKAKNKKSKSISSLGRKKKTDRDEQDKSNRNVTLDETGSLKRNISKVTTKALADKNLPAKNKVFWALTKVHIFDDGSQELDILDITSTPPGHYMVSDTNKLVLMGQQPSKAK